MGDGTRGMGVTESAWSDSNCALVTAARFSAFENRQLTFQAESFLLDAMSASITSLSAQQLRHAADLKEKIQSLQNELNHILSSQTKPVAVAAPKGRRKISAAVRAKMAAAAKARWAKIKTAKKQLP